MKRGKKPGLTVLDNENPAFKSLGQPPVSWTGEQKALWFEVSSMIPERVACKCDRILVEMTCRLLADIRAGEAKTATFVELRRQLGELGLTPSERLRLTKELPPKREENPFADL